MIYVQTPGCGRGRKGSWEPYEVTNKDGFDYIHDDALLGLYRISPNLWINRIFWKVNKAVCNLYFPWCYPASISCFPHSWDYYGVLTLGRRHEPHVFQRKSSNSPPENCLPWEFLKQLLGEVNLLALFWRSVLFTSCCSNLETVQRSWFLSWDFQMQYDPSS